MPTVILLDVSLSMCRPMPRGPPSSGGVGGRPGGQGGADGCPGEEPTRLQLAVAGINAMLDYLSANCKMEFVSLVIFSSLYEPVVPFTRDHSEIRLALTRLLAGDEMYSKTCVGTALCGVGTLVTDEWGLSPMCQVLLVTDGNPGVGDGSLRQYIASLAGGGGAAGGDRGSLHPVGSHEGGSMTPPNFPFRFASRLDVLCIASNAESVYATGAPLYRQLISINGGCGELISPELSPHAPGLPSTANQAGGGGAVVVETAVRQMFVRLAERLFAPFVGALVCGNMRGAITILPPLEPYDKVHEFERVRRSVSKEIEVCGFIDLRDVSSPPYISRHLLLPLSSAPPASKTDSEGGAAVGPAVGGSRGGDEGGEEKEVSDKSPALTVLLHGSLKVEGMIALAQIGPDWYGMLYSFADGKKKSNLFLSVFQPGTDVLPWLGRLDRLGPLSDLGLDPGAPSPPEGLFPVMPADRRSYTQNCVVWIKSSGLQADIQKILRNAKKLPEKHVHFYKELNRLRRAALSFGFYELLVAMATLLDRECTQLPGNAHPDAALQMTHAAKVLRSGMARDAAFTIQPLRTNFSVE